MNIYVGNLSGEVAESDLQELFEQFGEVASVNIIKDRFSGESRGFGFVEMPSRQEAEAAIEEANGKELKGYVIKVNQAKPKAEKPGFGRRGGGGGRGRNDRRSGQGRGRSRGGERRGGDRGGNRY